MVANTMPKLMTAGDLLNVPDDGYHRYELVRGRLVCMSPSTSRSARVAARLLARVGIFVEQHELGAWGGMEWGFRIATNPDTVRAPDVAFVRAERVSQGGRPDEFWQGAPDFAVEVVSPTDRYSDIIDKVREYLDTGTRLVWAIDPGPRTAIVFRRDGTYTWLGEHGTLNGEDVLPGFTLPLAQIWV